MQDLGRELRRTPLPRCWVDRTVRTRTGWPSVKTLAYTASLEQAAEGGEPMAEQRHGRYYAQELMMDEGANVRERIQDALDAGEERE
jgi:hypothetical protein